MGLGGKILLTPKQSGSLPYNPRMTNIEIIVPFALPPSEHAKDLLAELQLPGFARLLAHAKRGQQQKSAAFAPALPHEQYLAKSMADNSPPVAKAAMQILDIAEHGHWFLLQAASLHIARDHLLLTDRRQLGLSDAESRSLFDIARPFINDSGFDLRYGDAGNWFLRADAWKGLRTCTPDAACGHNIDIWLPTGEGERAWRKLLNELQMLWHTHPVNDAREARGARRINSAWLWGGADEVRPSAALTLLARLALNQHQPQSEPALLDSLIAPALAGEWANWLHEFAQLEQTCFAPLCAALKQSQINNVTLVLSDSSRLQTWNASRASMRKFWIKPSLARLVS